MSDETPADEDPTVALAPGAVDRLVAIASDDELRRLVALDAAIAASGDSKGLVKLARQIELFLQAGAVAEAVK